MFIRSAAIMIKLWCKIIWFDRVKLVLELFILFESLKVQTFSMKSSTAIENNITICLKRNGL